mmetsp:Transcript_33849/g.83170  ORF Transcript_33849/g.83170 Transcript_33849/m.83170 type:complete len:294 (-) Transcript_33849:579-1460(-)
MFAPTQVCTKWIDLGATAQRCARAAVRHLRGVLGIRGERGVRLRPRRLPRFFFLSLSRCANTLPASRFSSSRCIESDTDISARTTPACLLISSVSPWCVARTRGASPPLSRMILLIEGSSHRIRIVAIECSLADTWLQCDRILSSALTALSLMYVSRCSCDDTRSLRSSAEKSMMIGSKFRSHSCSSGCTSSSPRDLKYSTLLSTEQHSLVTWRLRCTSTVLSDLISLTSAAVTPSSITAVLSSSVTSMRRRSRSVCECTLRDRATSRSRSMSTCSPPSTTSSSTATGEAQSS